MRQYFTQANMDRLKAAGILQQFEAEMGIGKPTVAAESAAPSVGTRIGEKQGP